MKGSFQIGLRWLAAIMAKAFGAPSSTPVCAAEVVGGQCACAIRSLDYVVRSFYLNSENGVPVKQQFTLPVTTRYFILGTMMDPGLPAREGQEPFLFPEMHRFRVDASWARPPVRRGIGPTINLSARHQYCRRAHYRIGQQYLLYVGFAGDTLVTGFGCGVVHPSDSARTRAAIVLLDSALKRR